MGQYFCLSNNVEVRCPIFRDRNRTYMYMSFVEGCPLREVPLYMIYHTHTGAFGKVHKGVLVTDIDGSLNETTVAIKLLRGKYPFLLLSFPGSYRQSFIG